VWVLVVGLCEEKKRYLYLSFRREKLLSEKMIRRGRTGPKRGLFLPRSWGRFELKDDRARKTADLRLAAGPIGWRYEKRKENLQVLRKGDRGPRRKHEEGLE